MVEENVINGVRVEAEPLQEAKDPNLCYWAEFYFLALMADAFLENKPLDFMQGQVVGEDGELSECYFLQKGRLKDVAFSGWGDELRSVKLGQPTALVLTGKHEDVILIPNGNHFITGREIGVGFEQIEGLVASVGDNQYIQAANERITTAASVLGADTYDDLYRMLKETAVENIGVGE